MRGRSIPLSTPRRFIADLCWLANRTPIGVIGGRISVASALAARRAAPRPAIPLSLLFTKAYAIVARETPELRRSFVPFPLAHLYEVEQSVASLMVVRDWNGEQAAFPARLKDPASRSLRELAAVLDEALSDPPETSRHFGKLARLSRLPTLARRALWLYGFNSGRQRPNYFGTFGVSVLGHLGAEIVYPMSPLTSFVSYGPIGADGSVDIKISFDHRVMDGGTIATAIKRLEEVLNSEIVAELEGLGLTA
ncbi:MAG: 2-oxo acid dehydrogenase subunit E2 [Microvirga sp.]|nr:2-oxo acid dehydrogenase subunit E2 [Microvirga sp.]